MRFPAVFSRIVFLIIRCDDDSNNGMRRRHLTRGWVFGLLGLAGCYFPAVLQPQPVAHVESAPVETTVASQPAPMAQSVQPMVAAVCPANTRELGRIATWCGKVNVHTGPSGEWLSDGGCNTGCNEPIGDYCQALYPSTTHAAEVGVTQVDKPFHTAGCRAIYPSPGHNEFICCGH